MKRVFEGVAYKLDNLGSYFSKDFCKTMVGFENKIVIITIEDLPESKPEQPKPAEPQTMEQRFDTFWKSYADKEDVLYTWNNCQRRKDELLSFIRAEIDRAWGDGFKAGHDIAEENRSNE